MVPAWWRPEVSSSHSRVRGAVEFLSALLHLLLLVSLRCDNHGKGDILRYGGSGASVIFIGELLWIFAWWCQVDSQMCHSGMPGLESHQPSRCWEPSPSVWTSSEHKSTENTVPLGRWTWMEEEDGTCVLQTPAYLSEMQCLSECTLLSSAA